MSNLLKEAIADAKAVRATALANAKAALEEAFQPKLEAMLVEKLKNYAGPIDLITGRQDPVGESVVYEAKTVFPQLNYTFIERCGHFPWLEREDRSKIFYDLFDKSLDLN